MTISTWYWRPASGPGTAASVPRSTTPTISRVLPGATRRSIRGTAMSARTLPSPAISQAGPPPFAAVSSASAIEASRSSCAARIPGTISAGSLPQWPSNSSRSIAARATLSSGACSMMARSSGGAAAAPPRTTARSVSRGSPLPQTPCPLASAACTTGWCSGQRQFFRSKPYWSSHASSAVPPAGGGIGPALRANCSNTTAGWRPAAVSSAPRTWWWAMLSWISPSSTKSAARARRSSSAEAMGAPVAASSTTVDSGRASAAAGATGAAAGAVPPQAASRRAGAHSRVFRMGEG